LLNFPPPSDPETAGRTLEEIDLLYAALPYIRLRSADLPPIHSFAKGFAENRSYVSVSLDMQKNMTDQEVRSELDRLHREHEIKKGRSVDNNADEATLHDADVEVNAEIKAQGAQGEKNQRRNI
jgi:hypothetical protein